MYPPEHASVSGRLVTDDVENPWLIWDPDGRRALALPVGLALTASLGFLPAASASAAPAGAPAAATAADRRPEAVVRRQHRQRPHRRQAGEEGDRRRPAARSSSSYDQIGVIVAHSQNPDFGARRSAAYAGVQSAGATRTAPLAAARPPRTSAPSAAADRGPGGGRGRAGHGGAGPAGAAAVGPARDQGGQGAPEDAGQPEGHGRRHRHGRRRHPPGPGAQLRPRRVRQLRRRRAGHHRRRLAAVRRARATTARMSRARSPPRRTASASTGVAPGVKVSGIKVTDPGRPLLHRGRRLRLRLGRRARRRRDEQQLLHRPVALQLQGRPGPGRPGRGRRPRAAKYAERKGTVNVAAAGNSNHDLASDTIDGPDQPERHHAGRPRTIDPRESASTSRPSCRASSPSPRRAPRA